MAFVLMNIDSISSGISGVRPALLVRVDVEGEDVPSNSKTYITRGSKSSFGSAPMIGANVQGSSRLAAADGSELVYPFERAWGTSTYPDTQGQWERYCHVWKDCAVWIDRGVYTWNTGKYGQIIVIKLGPDARGVVIAPNYVRYLTVQGAEYNSYHSRTLIPTNCEEMSPEQWVDWMRTHDFYSSHSLDWSTIKGVNPNTGEKEPLSYLQYLQLVRGTWYFPNPNVRWFNETITPSGQVAFTDPSPALYQAYMSAIDSLPKDDVNWFANALDAVHLIVSIVTLRLDRAGQALAKKVGNLPRAVLKGASSGWLSYRYVYSTTKADIEDTTELVSRVAQLRRQLKTRSTIHVNGTAYAHDGAEVHVSLTYEIMDVLGLDSFFAYSLPLLAYDAWDLIPFSFIIDWFTSVGDILHDHALRSLAISLHPVQAWVSYTYVATNSDGDSVNRYFRTTLHGIPKRPDSYTYVESSKTTLSLKRAADSLALVFGLL